MVIILLSSWNLILCVLSFGLLSCFNLYSLVLSLQAFLQGLLVGGHGDPTTSSCQVRLCQRQTTFYQLTSQPVMISWTEVPCGENANNGM